MIFTRLQKVLKIFQVPPFPKHPAFHLTKITLCPSTLILSGSSINAHCRCGVPYFSQGLQWGWSVTWSRVPGDGCLQSAKQGCVQHGWFTLPMPTTFQTREKSQKWHGGGAVKGNILFDIISSYGAESLTVVKSQNVWFKLIFYSLFIYLFIYLFFFKFLQGLFLSSLKSWTVKLSS